MAPDTSVKDWFVLAEFLIAKACLHAVGKKKSGKITAKLLKTKLLALIKHICCHLYGPNVMSTVLNILEN